MRYIKYILPAIFLFFTAIGCRKSTITPIRPIDTDAFFHAITFDAPAQYVTTSVTGATLDMIFYENINLFIPKEGYNLTYALHLREDFTNAVLYNFTFTTVDAEGDVTTDWVDDNLNNITAKTVKDTTINGKALVRVTVQRPFTFTKTYTDNKAAVDAQAAILKLTKDKINFSSYAFFTRTYPATTTSTTVLYVK